MRDYVTERGEDRMEWNVGGARGIPEFLVTPLLMGPVCLLNQGLFEEPVRPWFRPARPLYMPS